MACSRYVSQARKSVWLRGRSGSFFTTRWMHSHAAPEQLCKSFCEASEQNVLEAASPEVLSLNKGKNVVKQSLNKRALKDSPQKVLAKVVETHVAAGGATGGDGAAAGGRATGGRPSGWEKKQRLQPHHHPPHSIKEKVCKKKSGGYFG